MTRKLSTHGTMHRAASGDDVSARLVTTGSAPLNRAILTNPLVVKRDGRREEFDPDKLMSGLRIACARRPISRSHLDASSNVWNT